MAEHGTTADPKTIDNIEDTKPIDVLASRVWSGTHWHYPHIERMAAELTALREENARWGEIIVDEMEQTGMLIDALGVRVDVENGKGCMDAMMERIASLASDASRVHMAESVIEANKAVISELVAKREAAEKLVQELRRKLAEAGVEGSPPPSGDTTIGMWMKRAREAEARAAGKDNAADRIYTLAEAKRVACAAFPDSVLDRIRVANAIDTLISKLKEGKIS